jgi:hypothetical protein
MLDRDWFVRRDAVSAMKDYSGMSRANVNKRIREMFLAGKLETRPSNDKKVEELRIKRGPESNTPEAGEMQRDMAAAFGGNTRADVPDRDGDDTEQALREIYKDLDPEKRERMIQGVLGTEVRA